MLKIPLTREQLEAKRIEAHERYGIIADGDNGMVRYLGVTVNYSYDGEDLTLTVMDRPFLLPQNVILSSINRAFVQ